MAHYSSYNPYSLWGGEDDHSVFDGVGSSVVAVYATVYFYSHDGY